MCAIAANTLYTAWRKRGTTRQLAFVIVGCVCSALLLLPTIIWYNVRLSVSPASVGVVEAACALIYVALWGCLAPLGATTAYCLYTRPRESHTSARMPRQRAKTTKGNAAAIAAVRLPRRQPGVPAPFVYGDDIPWGWLEHRAGRFQGQKLALKRAVSSIGREEDNEIWLDDETSSRYHAELAWQDEQAYITDCDSMNGVILNGRRMRGTLPINSGDLLEIGSHRFLFEIAPRPASLTGQDDPLLRHLRRPSSALDQSEEEPFERNAASFAAPPTKPIHEELFAEADNHDGRDLFESAPQPAQGIGNRTSNDMPAWMHTLRPDPVTPPPLPHQALPRARSSMCLIHNGSLSGKSFLLDRPVLRVGQSSDCDVLLDDASITLEYARFTCQSDGDYVSGPGVKVNDKTLRAPRLLQQGDIISLGATHLEYSTMPDAQTTPLPAPP